MTPIKPALVVSFGGISGFIPTFPYRAPWLFKPHAPLQRVQAESFGQTR